MDLAPGLPREFQMSLGTPCIPAACPVFSSVLLGSRIWVEKSHLAYTRTKYVLPTKLDKPHGQIEIDSNHEGFSSFLVQCFMHRFAFCLRIGYRIPQKLIEFDGLSVIIVLHLRGIPNIYPCIGIPNDGTPLPLSRKGVSSPIGPRPRIPLRCSWGNQGKNHPIWWWKELETSVFRGVNFVNPYSSGTKAMWRTT